MARLGIVSAVVATLVGATAATTQSLGVPAEFPPANFAGNQFVDSQGCAFIRAGRNGVTNWVPRVNRRRQQLCNFEPTFGPDTPAGPPPIASAVPVAPLDAPIIEITAPPPTAADAPNPLRRLFGSRSDAPVETAEAPAPAPVEPAPSPRIIEAAAPVPAPVSEPAVTAPAAAPEPSRVTLAQACDGKFGVQPGFISARTGDPIDCGPAPAVASAPVPAPAPAVEPEPARVTFAEACDGRFGIQSGFISATTGNPIDCGPAPQQVASTVTAPTPTPAPERMSLAQACAEIGTTGRRYISAQTGEPIVCPGTAPAATVAGLFKGNTAVPASNPAATAQQATRPPAGNERVWGDGRLNPNRGLPANVVTATDTAAAAQRVSTRSTPQRVAAPSHRYVQVASFSDAANADRLIQRLGAAGFPVGAGQSRGMKIVAVGPFQSQADLQRALQTVRGMGFGDAFLRN